MPKLCVNDGSNSFWLLDLIKDLTGTKNNGLIKLFEKKINNNHNNRP